MKKTVLTGIALAVLMACGEATQSVDYYVDNSEQLKETLEVCAKDGKTLSEQTENCQNAFQAEEYINKLKKVAAEGITMSAIAKLALSEVRSTDGIWGKDNQSIGIPRPEQAQSDNVKSVEVKDGEVIISFKSLDSIIIIRPEDKTTTGRINWVCDKNTTFDKRYLPEKCRAEIDAQN